jgi:hypothetical protein
MAMIEWKEDADIEGWTGGVGCTWALDIWPHAKGGWSWCIITDDAGREVPEGWDLTLEDAMVHSERAYVGWLDGTGEHDETADIVADAVAQERAAVVAFLREQAGQWDRDAAGWSALNHASVMIERGLHCAGEGA